ncbi:hypothetical protein DB346_16300 [Verrucomicrobia bacterium LW23]|nr:hypothetical protein DB346_16300 [Verrucomicrobia bacterium LW23]
MNRIPVSRRNSRGFSLIELLAVITVMAVVSTLITPSFSSMLLSVKVRQASGQIASLIERARLEAGTHNRPIELRFYREANGGHYTGMQLFILRDAGMVAHTPFIRLPEGTAIANDTRSSLLQEPGLGAGTTGAWTYRSFEVASDGETNLPRRELSLCLAVGSVQEINASANGAKDAPGLFAVLIDPVVASTRVVGR